jgi:glutathione-regulated potassium-efflux system ancillary protein KefG
MRRILVLFAHPALHKSRINSQLAAAVRSLDGVTFHDLYEAYPDFLIDVEKEQRLLLEHDLIVVQHPFYWYSTPAIFKEWMDLVLEYGFAYGPGGDRLHGKSWLQVLTAGGAKKSYGAEGHNVLTVEELLAPFVQTAHLCGMTYLDPLIVYGTLKLDQKTDVPLAAAAYRDRLIALRDG